jgi:hypothetical protein
MPSRSLKGLQNERSTRDSGDIHRPRSADDGAHRHFDVPSRLSGAPRHGGCRVRPSARATATPCPRDGTLAAGDRAAIDPALSGRAPGRLEPQQDASGVELDTLGADANGSSVDPDPGEDRYGLARLFRGVGDKIEFVWAQCLNGGRGVHGGDLISPHHVCASAHIESLVAHSSNLYSNDARLKCGDCSLHAVAPTRRSVSCGGYPGTRTAAG